MRKIGLQLNDNQRFLIRNVSIIELGLFINQVLQTVVSMILAAVLNDPVRFGEVNLLLQIFGMVALFLNVGFNSALVYAFSTERAEVIRSKYRWALLGSAFFGLVVGLLLAALAPWLAQTYKLPSLKGALMVGSLLFFFNSIVNIGLASFSGSRVFGTQAFFMVLATVFSTAGTLLGVLRPIGSMSQLSSVSLWMGVGALLTAVCVCWRVEQVHRPRWLGSVSLSGMRSMMAYGVPLWAGNIAKAFQQPFLVMMIGSTSVVAVGQLANGLRITGFIGIVTWAFMIVTFPFVAESSQNPAEIRRRGTLCVRYNNVIMYPLTLLICLYPNPINETLFGSEYTTDETAIYIRLLALGVFFSSVSRLGGSILAGVGKTKANFYSMIAAGLFVILLVPLTAADNPVLAVWIYTGGWTLSALVMIWFIRHEQLPLNWWKAYGEPALPSLGMGAGIELGRFVGMTPPWLIVLGVTCLVLLTYYFEGRNEPRAVGRRAG